jgi:hypothetical protein
MHRYLVRSLVDVLASRLVVCAPLPKTVILPVSGFAGLSEKRACSRVVTAINIRNAFPPTATLLCQAYGKATTGLPPGCMVAGKLITKNNLPRHNRMNWRY